jgi:ribonuclease D
MPPELIESSTEMDELLNRLNNCKLIAVDTEFFRETSYYPQLALVQIATDSIVACIDPLAFDAKSALRKILLDEQITKIFHSCSQDMEVLFYYLGDTPKSIYDTQIANALLSEHQQIGYASLVENELGMQLDKSQTRTNWLQRPLTDKQLQYAGDDVFYLYQLHNLLDEKLQDADRKTWFDEESLALSCNENDFQVAIDKLWKRVKGATRLNKNKLAIVQSIAQWREQLAQKKDKTRRKILSDDIIIQLALSPPENIDMLDQSIGRRYHFNNEAKLALIESITTAKNSSPETWPDNRFDILDQQQKSLLKNLQLLIKAKAEKLGISSAILCSRRDLEKLILLHTSNKAILKQPTQSGLNIMQGWRYHSIGQQLIEALENAIENSK